MGNEGRGVSGRDRLRSGTSAGVHLEANLTRFDRWAIVLMAAVCLLLICYCAGQAAGWAAFATSISVLACVLVASSLAGALGGFVFGIPRLLARGDTGAPTPAAPLTREPGARPATRPLVGNSNLEEISDWVTKILVGLGLVHANSAASTVRGLATYVSTNGLHAAPASELMVLGAGLSGFLIGFLYFYLQTRTRITLMFFAAEDVQGSGGIRSRDIDAANQAPIAEEGIREAAVAALSARIGTPNAVAAAVPADAAILAVGFNELRSSEEFAAWGAAQARTGNLEAAETALQRANALDAGNALILRRLAEVRGLQGDARRAVESLREAGAKSPGEWRIRRRELFYSLFLPMPDSFMRALALAEELAQHPEGGLDPMVHVWRACAYGQKYRWLTGLLGTDEVQSAVRTEALVALKKAVSLAPDPDSPQRKLMRRLLDPSVDPANNDLADFTTDADFRAVVDNISSQTE